MSQANRCPECGAELPPGSLHGLCPKCLLAAGLESRDEPSQSVGSGSGAPTTPHSGIFVPPEPAALAAYFPQLEILELLGHGGMGAVYKARQPRLDRLVALKIIRPESADTPEFAERFNREAKTLARLSHPQIVAVYDFGSVDISLREMIPHAEREEYIDQPRSLYFVIMEYVDGPNLRQLMRTGELTPQQALAIVPQICDALQFAHNEGVVHRDIKPENILLDKRGRVKIADFGLAKLAGRSADELTLTGTHQVMGTPRYMAPEQMEGSHAVDHRADIYSLGVVFYEMLTGEVPMGHFEPPSKKVEIDVRLDEIVLRALAREPDRRYQRASEVKTDMESIITAPPPQAPGLHRETADDPQIEAARQLVQFPAIGLIVIGGLSLALGILAALVMSSWAFRHASSDGSSSVLAIPAIILFTALPTAMIVGGLKMLRLTSHRWAVDASVLAVSPIPAGPLWLLSLPLGIWSLVVLAKPEVKQGFALRAQPLKRDALSNVQNPAWGLIITGIISWITIPFAFWIPIVRNLDATQRTIFQISFGVIPLVVGTTMALAGFQMKRLEGYRLTLFAAVLPIVVLICKLIGLSFGPLGINPADLIGAPIGLWVLVVLSRSDVKAAFRAGSASASSQSHQSVPASAASQNSLSPAGRVWMTNAKWVAVATLFMLYLLGYRLPLEVSDVMWALLFVLCLPVFAFDALRHRGKHKGLKAAFGLLAASLLPLLFIVVQPQPLLSWLYRAAGGEPGQGDPTFVRLIAGVVVVWIIWQMFQLQRKIADEKQPADS